MNNKFRHLRVGLLGIGLDTYWSQFEGLRSRLLGYLSEVEAKISYDREVVNLGLVDTPGKALEAGHACRRNDIDILLIYVTTYALSSTVLPVVLRAKVPVLLLNLQPEAAVDYASFNRMESRTAMTGEWLAYCNSCPVPEIANVLRRLDIPFQQITGMLHNDVRSWQDLEHWLTAAEVAKTLSHSRLGLMGHYYSGMLDIATDLTQVSGRFGLDAKSVEVDELSRLCEQVSQTEISEKMAEFDTFFDIDSDCPKGELVRAARTAVGLDHLVHNADLDLMAYYYSGSGITPNESAMNSIILGSSILTGKGVPVAGEYEIKNAIAMKILDCLGAGGSFTEYYAMDFAADRVLMGHDGPGHIRIAQDKIKVRPLQVYHGKTGKGLSVEMSVKHGPVTLLSVVEDKRHGFGFLVAEGQSVPGEILKIGNTNSQYQFPIGARNFVEQWNLHGPAHHCAIGVGDLAEQIEKLASLLQLSYTKVC